METSDCSKVAADFDSAAREVEGMARNGRPVGDVTEISQKTAAAGEKL